MKYRGVEMLFLLSGQNIDNDAIASIGYATQYAEQVVPIVVKTITDWNMFWGAVGVGLLSVVATVIAVLYTQWKTSQQYEETIKVNEQRHNEELARYKADKERQEYENALVIIKPSLKYASFSEIRDRLMVDGNEERALLLSSNEGFEFYDDINQRGNRHCIFSINNESRNRIEYISLDVSSEITTATHHAKEPYEFKSSAKWLGRNDFIENTQQQATRDAIRLFG